LKPTQNFGIKALLLLLVDATKFTIICKLYSINALSSELRRGYIGLDKIYIV